MIDPNIPLSGLAPKFDNPMDVANKAMTLKQLSMQTQAMQQQADESQALKGAFKNNTVTDASGNTTLNRQGLMSNLNEINPEKALHYQKMFQDADLEKLRAQGEIGKILAWKAAPDNWANIKQTAVAQGLPNADKMPDTFDPQFVKKWQIASLDGEKQLDYHLKQQDMVFKQQELGLKHQEAYAKRAEKETEQKKMSVPEAKQMGLYNYGAEAEKAYQAATGPDSYYDPSASTNWIDKNDLAPNFLKSDKAIEANSAQDRWVEAYLRDASGAAIPPSERGAYGKDFFPIAGDSEQVIKDKAKARQMKMQSAYIAATGGGQAPPQDVASNPQGAQDAPKEGGTVTHNGVTYVGVNGHWVPQNTSVAKRGK